MQKKKEFHYVIKILFKVTNNEVEHKALMARLVVAEALGAKEVDV